MQAIALLALVGAAAAIPAAVTSAIAPQETAPAGCSSSYTGSFEISIVNLTTTSKRSIQKRKDLTITLANGVLTDDEGRTGYIASNNQFQFDKPAQAGAIYTAGWSACGNGTLALGNSAVFYQCLSGTFYNLYDESEGAQCSPIFIDIVPTSGDATPKAAGVTASSDGQVTAASASAGAVTQITDGQIQATTATPVVSQISDGQIQASTGVVVTQISDGQIQATTGTPKPAVVTQISDGQIQATTGTSKPAVVTQISDGQIQATTGTSKPAVVTQISDGQIQATTGTSKPAVVTQISDGQIQAATATPKGAVVTQISDGQIQYPTNGTGSSTKPTSVVAFTGAATMPTMRAEIFGLAAGILALAAL